MENFQIWVHLWNTSLLYKAGLVRARTRSIEETIPYANHLEKRYKPIAAFQQTYPTGDQCSLSKLTALILPCPFGKAHCQQNQLFKGLLENEATATMGCYCRNTLWRWEWLCRTIEAMRRPKSISEEEMMRSPEEKEVGEPENPRKQTGRLEKRKETQLGTQAVSCDCSLFLCFMRLSFSHRGSGRLQTGREAAWVPRFGMRNGGTGAPSDNTHCFKMMFIL